MMTSSNENIFHITGPTGEVPSQRSVTRSFDAFFDLNQQKRLSWANNQNACDFRLHRAHYDVTVIYIFMEP